VVAGPSISERGKPITLRLPSGREGAVILMNVDLTNELGPVAVSGSGPVPFD
jgi:hypothetical protein